MKQITIVGFGDSLTFGYGVDKNITFLSRLEKELPLYFSECHWSIVNSGVNGDTTREALQRIETDVLQFSPHIVLILFGSNDSSLCEDQYRTTYEFEKNLHIILKKLNSLKLTNNFLNASPIPVFITPPPVIETNFLPFNTTDRVKKYCEIVKKISADENLFCIDFFTLLNNIGQENIIPYFQHDGIHLSPKGYDFLYHCICFQLEDLFRLYHIK